MYAVVEFTKMLEVEVVPKLWLRNGGKDCLWPPHRNSTAIKKSVEQAEVPGYNWVQYEVRVMKETGMRLIFMLFLWFIYDIHINVLCS